MGHVVSVKTIQLDFGSGKAAMGNREISEYSQMPIKLCLWPGVVVCACNPSYLGSRGTKIESSGPAQTKLVKPCLKIKTKQQTNKKAGGVAQVVEPLPSTVGPSFNS
jgi:hypothetical protein